MAFIASRVLQEGLVVLTENADTLHICTEMPYTFDAAAEASIAFKRPVSISAPAASAAHSGQDVTVAPITDGEVNKTGFGMFFALVDSVNGELLTAGPLGRSQILNNGNLFSLDAFTVGIPAA